MFQGYFVICLGFLISSMITYNAYHDLEISNVIFYRCVILVIMLLLFLQIFDNTSEKGHSK